MTLAPISKRWVTVGAVVAVGALTAWLALQDRHDSQLRRETLPAARAQTASIAAHGLSPFAALDGKWAPKVAAPAPVAPAIETGPLYGRNGREIDLGGLTAAQYIDRHVGAARQGDARAAYEVYKAESACAVGNETIPAFNLPEQRVQLLQEREALAALCARVSPAQMQERMGFLAQAARAGLRDAQIDFYMEGPYGRTLDNVDPDDPLVKTWQQESLVHLGNAAAQCDPYAMGLLANAWDAGHVGRRDVSLAARYLVAEASSRRAPLSLEQLTARFGDELAPEQLQDSMRAGQNLARDACTNN